MRTLCATVVLLLGLADARAAELGRVELERAQAELQQLHFDRALEALDAALRAGDSPPRQLARIHRLLGEVSASLGLTDAAVEHFQHWLALEPSGALAEGASPKLSQPLADARRALAGRPPLQVHARIDDAPPSITLVVDSDPLSMVAGARATVGASVLAHTGAGELTIPLPPGHVELELSALDRYGNRLVDLGTIVVDHRPPPKRLFLTRWYTWGAVALAAAAIGTGFGGAAASAQSDLDQAKRAMPPPDFRDVRAIESSARADALGCNISFGLAGAFAITSVVLLAVELHHRKARLR
jgi:tetratricopeptide (TPR) repeat protein